MDSNRCRIRSRSRSNNNKEIERLTLLHSNTHTYTHTYIQTHTMKKTLHLFETILCLPLYTVSNKSCHFLLLLLFIVLVEKEKKGHVIDQSWELRVREYKKREKRRLSFSY